MFCHVKLVWEILILIIHVMSLLAFFYAKTKFVFIFLSVISLSIYGHCYFIIKHTHVVKILYMFACYTHQQILKTYSLHARLCLWVFLLLLVYVYFWKPTFCLKNNVLRAHRGPCRAARRRGWKGSQQCGRHNITTIVMSWWLLPLSTWSKRAWQCS